MKVPFSNTGITKIDPSTTRHSEKLNLSAGQVFRGKIIKFFPHQKALVQLGGQRFYAQLEAALSAEKGYIFQVQNSDHFPQLKVIGEWELKNAPSAKTDQQLLKMLQIPPSKSVVSVMNYLLDQKLPFTKEMLVHSSSWTVEKQNQQQAKQAVAYMAAKQLPFSNAVFQAVYQLLDNQSLGGLLSELSSQLQASGEQSRMDQLFTLLPGKPPVSNQLLKFLSESIIQETAAESSGVISLLKKLGLQQSELTALILANKQLNRHPSNPQSASESINALLKQARIHLSAEELIKSYEQLLSKESSLSEGERSIITKLQQIQFDKGNEVFQSIKKFLTSFGLSHEHDLLKGQTTTNLKAVLLEMAGDPSLSHDIKEKITETINKITAQQLVAHHTHGQLEQLHLQIPFHVSDRMIEVMMQFNGRKRADGEIDPSHCNIVFFVNLTNLGDVTAEVRIQNRIVSVALSTSEAITTQSLKVLKPQLAARLEALDYSLSSVRLVPVEAKETIKKTSAASLATQSSDLPTTYYQGVDFKI